MNFSSRSGCFFTRRKVHCTTARENVLRDGTPDVNSISLAYAKYKETSENGLEIEIVQKIDSSEGLKFKEIFTVGSDSNEKKVPRKLKHAFKACVYIEISPIRNNSEPGLM